MQNLRECKKEGERVPSGDEEVMIMVMLWEKESR
jgi:hypothetical protein